MSLAYGLDLFFCSPRDFSHWLLAALFQKLGSQVQGSGWYTPSEGNSSTFVSSCALRSGEITILRFQSLSFIVRKGPFIAFQLPDVSTQGAGRWHPAPEVDVFLQPLSLGGLWLCIWFFQLQDSQCISPFWAGRVCPISLPQGFQ